MLETLKKTEDILQSYIRYMPSGNTLRICALEYHNQPFHSKIHLYFFIIKYNEIVTFCLNVYNFIVTFVASFRQTVSIQ